LVSLLNFILIIDEIKIFEEKLEQDYTSMAGKNKINIDWPDNWLKSLRNKIEESKSVY
jgi:hypothetical protein